MIVDFDDLHRHQHRLDLLVQLREANPYFRCTVFAIPFLSPDDFLESLPEWIEVAVHGWDHRHSREAADWSYERSMDVLLACSGRFVDGFKAPGWQISDGTYEALKELGWWCADHWENDVRRPQGLRTYRLPEGAAQGADPEHWHGHIQNVCGNGLEETFPILLERVRAATDFQFVSEVVAEWRPLVAA